MTAQVLTKRIIVLYVSHLPCSIQCVLISLEVLGNPAFYGVHSVSYIRGSSWGLILLVGVILHILLCWGGPYIREDGWMQ